MFAKKEEVIKLEPILQESDIIQIIKNLAFLPDHQHCSKCGKVITWKDNYICDKEKKLVCQECIITVGIKTIKK